MMRWLLLVCCALLSLSCGSDDGLSCSLKDQTTLMDSDWPSFRLDSANTARSSIQIGTTQPNVRCIFPQVEAGGSCPSEPSSPIDTATVVGTDRLVVASRDGEVHVLGFDGKPIQLREDIDINATVNTPLLGADGSIYLSSSDGAVRRFEMDGTLSAIGSLLGFIGMAPVIDNEGVVYLGTLSGSFGAVCPNGGLRYNLLVAPTQAGAAITTDPDDPRGRALVLSGANNGRIQAVSYDGDLRWSFFASSQIQIPIVISETLGVYFAIDQSGRIYSGNVDDGSARSTFRAARCSTTTEVRCDDDRDCPAEEVCVGESISAAAALGGSRFYVATEGTGDAGGNSPGILYAIDIDPSGVLAPQSAWEFHLPASGRIQSSPAIASSCNGELVIFGADLDTCAGAEGAPCGMVFAVDETGLRWSVTINETIGRSSPTLRSAGDSGVVYIGTGSGRLYEIHPTQDCSTGDITANSTIKQFQSPKRSQDLSLPYG